MEENSWNLMAGGVLRGSFYFYFSLFVFFKWFLIFVLC